MLPPFRRAISHRATQLTKYSRRTDINSCFFGGRNGTGGAGGGGFFTRRAFKVGAAQRSEITVDAAAGVEGGQRTVVRR